MDERPDIRGVTVPHLRAWRNLRALTQAELAEKSNVSRATISSAEGGARIWVSHVRSLADALDVTPEDLQRQAPNRASG
jgi:transcriptional regulator with XRE-family HTH domain